MSANYWDIVDTATILWILTAETIQRYRETKLCVYSVIAANWDGGDGKICRYTFGTILTEEAPHVQRDGRFLEAAPHDCDELDSQNNTIQSEVLTSVRQ